MYAINRKRLPQLLLISGAVLPALLLAQGAATPPVDPNLTTPGELLVDPPTLQNLGFEWFIEGDANRNASVAVAYREQGTQQWKDALPLLRIGGERIYSQSQVDVITPPMFAGSILDLEPDTAYEARFTLTDPDGVGAKVNFSWNSPALDVLADYPGPGQDSHSVLLDYSVFTKVPQLDATDMTKVQNLYDASDLDFSLVRGAAAIDKGMLLPTVTDGYQGSAPDLGALERGVDAPHYGPRTN